VDVEVFNDDAAASWLGERRGRFLSRSQCYSFTRFKLRGRFGLFRVARPGRVSGGKTCVDVGIDVGIVVGVNVSDVRGRRIGRAGGEQSDGDLQLRQRFCPELSFGVVGRQ
jgi:hypothetical protein